MFDLHSADDELLKSESDPFFQPPSSSHSWLWIGATALVASAAVTAAYLAYTRQQAASLPVPPEPVRVAAPPDPARPLGAAAAPVILPPLERSDPLVRELVKGISSHPRVAAWLASKDLIRNFTVVVASVAEGKTPARQLPMLRPSSDFGVIERNGGLDIDPASYARYDAIAAAAAAIDPVGAARLYATLKPRIEEAYRDLGYRDTSFDQALERAIVSLVQVPVQNGPVPVVTESQGIGYAFAAPKIQALTDAQKQLLRTGPRNQRLIQASLHEIALALGIRLPKAG